MFLFVIILYYAFHIETQSFCTYKIVNSTVGVDIQPLWCCVALFLLTFNNCCCLLSRTYIRWRRLNEMFIHITILCTFFSPSFAYFTPSAKLMLYKLFSFSCMAYGRYICQSLCCTFEFWLKWKSLFFFDSREAWIRMNDVLPYLKSSRVCNVWIIFGTKIEIEKTFCHHHHHQNSDRSVKCWSGTYLKRERRK